ncbi:MAG: cell wall hydrolase [Alphaproteobacteria bacterium]|nr:cell wall hydrolase [Alphaproteobacteria bacterium]
MQLTLIKNNDDEKIALYKLARIIYAETRAVSLPAVEALCSMVGNLCRKSGRPLADIIADESVFESLDKKSQRHCDLLISSDDPKFQMCLRVVKRMAAHQLADTIRGAARFHRTENSPEWARNRGWVAEIDGLLFYPGEPI